MTETPTLVEVRLEQLPLDVYRQAAEHSDELLREFVLIKERDPAESRYVPRRLLALIANLSDRFSGFSIEQTNQLDAALARGERSIDLVYRVPPEVKQATLELDAMLDEADEFCRQGRELLTLATPPEALAFRRWFLGEFARQIEGETPMPWPQFRHLTGQGQATG